MITDKSVRQENNWSLFKQGVLTNALNPKVAIFFLSFLPQFVDPSSAYLKVQMFVLGFWFAVQGTMVLFIVAFLLGRTTNFLNQKPLFWIWQEKITGLILVSLGLKLAFTTRNA
jgi:threonine/homoserine/homoserine lactone efflux protein